ncbi:MAG: GGDEF domain-containing protein [Terracidiphilus sp.]|nr:GGDEF domain-containing protein [Terracidiphilus sp.]
MPVLLALGTPSESKPLCSFYWLDGIQITLLIVFTFIYVFGSLPFVRFSGLPVPGFGSTSAFSIEQFVVALAATLRLQSRPSNRDVRIFWSCACLFLWLHAFCDSTYNFTNYFAASPPFRLQFLLAIPSLCILLCAFAQPNWGKSDARAPYRRNLALSLDNGSPVIFPALVALLAILCAFHHLRFSLVSIALSLFAYGIRSTVMQVRFQNIQLQMERNQAQLQRLALTDPLTGIANRRDFDIRLIQAWEQYVASNQPFSLLLIDVDYFKMLNDTYGHAEGDRCLRSIALVLQSTFRNDNDIVARFGGEEFAAIISEADLASAVSIARRMLRAVETLELRTQNPISDIVTISIGVAFSAGADSATVLLNRADQALYRAKRQGRNRVVSL